MTELIELNEAANNGDHTVIYKYAQKTLDEFEDNLVGVELGSAYGGNVEYIAKLWGDKGKFYGYDTFKGHPKQLAKVGEDFARDCMDYWYQDDVFGRDKLSYEYQRGVLDGLGLANAVLVKGLVREDSCKDLDKIHFAFLDMDLPLSMSNGYKAVKDKIVKDGYLLLHDVTQKDHIPGLYTWFNDEVLTSGMWEQIEESSRYLAVLRRV